MSLNNLKKILLPMMLRKRRKRKEKARKRRKFCVRDIFAKQEMHGEYQHLLPDLLSRDRGFYLRYLRMNPERFEHLLSLVKGKISKENTKVRTSISPRKRLVLTIRFLATRISQQNLSFAFRIGKTTVSNIMRETCEVIHDSLRDTCLRVPSSISEWSHISRQFEGNGHAYQGNLK